MLYYILFLHWVGDFVFQNEWMALNKCKLFSALTLHVITYTFILFIGTIYFLFNLNGYFEFILLNFGLHFVIDFITSRITAYYNCRGEMNKYFMVIGFDQFLHGITLMFTYNNIIK